jgi:hypothetical protein
MVSCFEFQIPLVLFGFLRMYARMLLVAIILEINTLEQQDRICYHQNICNKLELKP